MSDPTPSGAVFLSYAREDADAARRVADGLRAFAIEVWFDQNELRGGDAWDQKIRRQIRECALFMPVISARTQARGEGYFRREWKLAVERTHDMAHGLPFLMPVVIDDTTEGDALVPEEFLRVQWTRVAHGVPSPQFIEQVKHLLAAPSSRTRAAWSISPSTARAPAVERTAASPQSRRGPGRAMVFAAVALLAAAAIAGWQWQRGRKPAADSRPTSASAAKSAEKSIAVLAFANLSDDTASDHFGEGISEELLNVLGKVPGLRVAARTSSFYFKDKNLSPKQIAQELGVTHVVEGSVRKSGSRIRIRAELINATDGFPVWSDTIEKEQKDVLAVQEEIAGLIAQQLSLKLASSTAGARPVNPQAHALVLEGRHFWNQRTPDAFARAEEVYRQALQLDPGFAEAHAGLADVWMIRGWYQALAGSPATESDFSQAKVEAERARELNPLLAEPHACLAGVLYNQWKFADAEREFARAFALQPNYVMAHHWRAHLLGSVGRLDVALEEMERALSADPLAFISRWTYASHLNFAGRHEAALQNADRGLKISPKFIPLHGERAQALARLGRMEEAVASARMVTADLEFLPRFYADGDAIYVLRKAGLEAEAEAFAAKLVQQLPPDSHHRAFAHAALGRTTEALDMLATARPSTMSRVFYHPIWRPVHGTPQFQALLKKLGCVEEYQRAIETAARLAATK